MYLPFCTLLVDTEGSFKLEVVVVVVVVYFLWFCGHGKVS